MERALPPEEAKLQMPRTAGPYPAAGYSLAGDDEAGPYPAAAAAEGYSLVSEEGGAVGKPLEGTATAVSDGLTCSGQDPREGGGAAENRHRRWGTVHRRNVKAKLLPPKDNVIGCSPQLLMGKPLALNSWGPEEEDDEWCGKML